MVILKAFCRNAVMVQALTIQKTSHAAAAVKIMITAMFFAVLFASMVIYMIIVVACRGGTLPVLAYAILPAIDFICTLIIVFPAMFDRIRLAVSLIHMLIVRTFDGLAFAGLTCFVCAA